MKGQFRPSVPGLSIAFSWRERLPSATLGNKISGLRHIDDPPDDMSATPIDQAALDHMFSAAYEELRRLAASVRRDDPNATLSPTTLVNEAWLKLANSPPIVMTSKLHFKRIAARAMRQILIEAARRRQARKRGGADVALVTFNEAIDNAHGTTSTYAGELLALDDALDALERVQPRQAMMVESRFFGGLEVPEIAQLLGVSEATVLRDWRAAKAWLAHELRH